MALTTPAALPQLAAPWPAGPPGRPVLGSLVEFRRDLLTFLRACFDSYGDFVPVRVVFRRGFLVSAPDLVGEVLVRRHHDFRKVFMLRNNRLFLGNGLLTSEGDDWRRNRRLAQPAFHPDRGASYARIMVTEAERAAGAWRSGGVVDMQQEMMALTLRAVARCLFDLDTALDFERIGRCMEVIQGRMKQRLQSLVPLPDTAWTPRNIRLRRAVGELDLIIHGFVTDRRAGGATGPDLLSALMRARDDDDTSMTDRQLRDEVMTMLFAGHETTALALSWSWHLLAAHPEAETRLHDELSRVLGGRSPTADDLPRLEVTGQVVKEAMRLYPPVYAFGRDAVRDTVVGGHPVPAGASVIIAPWVMHRDPRLFAQPERFRPDRWTAEFERQLPRFAYCPFGGGGRMCIGKGFAMTEAVLVLATLAQRYRVQQIAGRPIELWPTFTLRSRHGLPMSVRPREG